MTRTALKDVTRPRLSDFMPVEEISAATTIPLKTIYNQRSSGKGALAPILVKIGGRLGCWRADYEAWRESQRRWAKGVVTCDAAPVGVSVADDRRSKRQ